jgi:hypothetical protein
MVRMRAQSSQGGKGVPSHEVSIQSALALVALLCERVMDPSAMQTVWT